MDTRRIKKLIELAQETGIVELEVQSENESVRITCQQKQVAGQAPVQQVVAPAQAAQAPVIPAKAETPTAEAPKHEHQDGHKVKSPMVGTVYLSSTPGAQPFVSVGQHVEAGETLCLIEAMKMFNKIEADKAGTISARLVDNGSPVEYDQPLFLIDSND